MNENIFTEGINLHICKKCRKIKRLVIYILL